MLAHNTSFVERLPSDNASTRSVVGEGLARIVPTMEPDVPPETPNVLPTAGLGTCLETFVGCIDRARQEVCRCGVPSIS